jgi:hypothetical protein
MYCITAEEQEKLLDEEMMQLNYERKMAILLHRSDNVLSKSRIKYGEKGSVIDNDGNGGNLLVDEAFNEIGSTKTDINDMILIAEKEAREIFNFVLDQQVNDERSARKGIKKDISEVAETDTNDSVESINNGLNNGENSKFNVKNKGAINVSVEVEQLLRKKKEDKKRKQMEALSCDYNPLDFMDWTARSL